MATQKWLSGGPELSQLYSKLQEKDSEILSRRDQKDLEEFLSDLEQLMTSEDTKMELDEGI